MFNCDICGSCCRAVGKLVISCIAALDEAEKTGDPVHPIVHDIAEFPHEINADGACSKLNSGGFCDIYESRPLICRTDGMYDAYWKDMMSREQWYSESKKSCMKLKAAYGKNIS